MQSTGKKRVLLHIYYYLGLHTVSLTRNGTSGIVKSETVPLISVAWLAFLRLHVWFYASILWQEWLVEFGNRTNNANGGGHLQS